ncbi:hypothetical protein C8J57DRAFT_1348141 [Mycena rebaudengoi]|nr:hypothetical protein C8J57DRAFT_1348141 [Mycena rebaudengoi]
MALLRIDRLSLTPMNPHRLQPSDLAKSRRVPLPFSRDVLESTDEYRAMMSPIGRLPYDILGELFSWSLPHLSQEQFCSTDMSLSPWILTRICRRWREISLSLPALWSHICIGGDRPIKLAVLAAQLDRSSPCRLTIRFPSEFHNIEAFRMLTEHSERWYAITLPVMDRWMVPLLDNVAGRMPLLFSLTYHYATEDCTVFETAPRLRHVINRELSSGFLPVPFAQLVRLRHPMPGTALATASLRLANNLTDLSLKSVGWIPFPWDTDTPITLPRLRVLFVSDGLFLDLMALPALEDIYVERNGLSLISLLRRSSCRLRKLVSSSPNSAETLSLLEHTPSLLELYCADFQLSVASRLTAPPPDPNSDAPDDHSEYSPLLAPALQTLYINFPPNVDFPKIVALMESRPALSLYVLQLSIKELTPDAKEARDFLRLRGFTVEWQVNKSPMRYLEELIKRYP